MQFEVWAHSVSLLRRGYESGSILSVDPLEASTWAHPPSRRRYIYNHSACPRCEDIIMSWTIAGRTCYACLTCQPRPAGLDAATAKTKVKPKKKKAASAASATTPTTGEEEGEAAASAAAGPRPAKLFQSHCAPESLASRLEQGAGKLSVSELREQLTQRGLSHKGLHKAALVEKLDAAMEPLTAIAAAAEKAAAGEGMAVEHSAELAPGQARDAKVRPPKRKMAVQADDEKLQGMQAEWRMAKTKSHRSEHGGELGSTTVASPGRKRARRAGDPMRAGALRLLDGPGRSSEKLTSRRSSLHGEAHFTEDDVR